MSAARPALFSIHDVMPSTLGATESIAATLRRSGIHRITLLVVPGTGWDETSLDRLRALHAGGADLAGHGWRHRVERIRGLGHWLHSTFISRDVAEHLALDRDGVIELMQQCYDWFAASRLPQPALYVPPAWAMGRARRADLDRLPYRRYETLAGIYDAESHRFERTPMIGFEADTRFRALACRLWNRLNLARRQRPVRFSIHPRDPELLLGDDLARLIERDWIDLYYTDPLAAPTR
jgi:predicted deacetylase